MSTDDQATDDCLVSEEGAGQRYIWYYDNEMPDHIRIRVRNSPFNLCCACLKDWAQRYLRWGYKNHWDEAVNFMENKIRAKQGEEYNAVQRHGQNAKKAGPIG